MKLPVCMVALFVFASPVAAMTYSEWLSEKPDFQTGFITAVGSYMATVPPPNDTVGRTIERFGACFRNVDPNKVKSKMRAMAEKDAAWASLEVVALMTMSISDLCGYPP